MFNKRLLIIKLNHLETAVPKKPDHILTSSSSAKVEEVPDPAVLREPLPSTQALAFLLAASEGDTRNHRLPALAALFFSLFWKYVLPLKLVIWF